MPLTLGAVQQAKRDACVAYGASWSVLLSVLRNTQDREELMHLLNVLEPFSFPLRETIHEARARLIDLRRLELARASTRPHTLTSSGDDAMRLSDVRRAQDEAAATFGAPWHVLNAALSFSDDLVELRRAVDVLEPFTDRLGSVAREACLRLEALERDEIEAAYYVEALGCPDPAPVASAVPAPPAPVLVVTEVAVLPSLEGVSGDVASPHQQDAHGITAGTMEVSSPMLSQESMRAPDSAPGPDQLPSATRLLSTEERAQQGWSRRRRSEPSMVQSPDSPTAAIPVPADQLRADLACTALEISRQLTRVREWNCDIHQQSQDLQRQCGLRPESNDFQRQMDILRFRQTEYTLRIAQLETQLSQLNNAISSTSSGALDGRAGLEQVRALLKRINGGDGRPRLSLGDGSRFTSEQADALLARERSGEASSSGSDFKSLDLRGAGWMADASAEQRLHSTVDDDFDDSQSPQEQAESQCHHCGCLGLVSTIGMVKLCTACADQHGYRLCVCERLHGDGQSCQLLTARPSGKCQLCEENGTADGQLCNCLCSGCNERTRAVIGLAPERMDDNVEASMPLHMLVYASACINGLVQRPMGDDRPQTPPVQLVPVHGEDSQTPVLRVQCPDDGLSRTPVALKKLSVDMKTSTSTRRRMAPRWLITTGWAEGPSREWATSREEHANTSKRRGTFKVGRVRGAGEEPVTTEPDITRLLARFMDDIVGYHNDANDLMELALRWPNAATLACPLSYTPIALIHGRGAMQFIAWLLSGQGMGLYGAWQFLPYQPYYEQGDTHGAGTLQELLLGGHSLTLGDGESNIPLEFLVVYNVPSLLEACQILWACVQRRRMPGFNGRTFLYILYCRAVTVVEEIT